MPSPIAAAPAISLHSKSSPDGHSQWLVHRHGPSGCGSRTGWNAAFVRELVASRHGHAALGEQGNSPWLFPGGRPGQPISAERLSERLRQLGLRPSQARSTALFALAAELPAALPPDYSASTSASPSPAKSQQRRLDQLRRPLQPPPNAARATLPTPTAPIARERYSDSSNI